MTRLILAGLTVLVATACAREQTTAPMEVSSDVAYFVGARIVTGDERSPIDNGALIVQGGRLTAVGAATTVPAPDEAVRVDLAGHTVMPVLHSLHVHLGYLRGQDFSAQNYSREAILDDLARHAYYGVGAVAVLGSDPGRIALDVRDAQRQGEAGGATLFTAGRGITSVGGWPTTIPALRDAPQQVATEEEARAAVATLADQGVDLVKVWVDDAGGQLPKLAPELYTAVIDEAHGRGLRVVAHVFYLDDAKQLVTAGIDGLVHSIRDLEVDDELIQGMVANAVFYVPTLVAHQAGLAYADQEPWIGEATLAETVPASIISALTSDQFVAAAAGNPSLSLQREQYRIAEINLKRLSDAGVTIAMGTDSGTPNRFPGFFEHRELELMVKAGLSPQEAITAATRNGAEILGLEDLGALGVGKRADFIVVEGDPLTDITASRQIAEVVREGKLVDRAPISARFIGTMP